MKRVKSLARPLSVLLALLAALPASTRTGAAMNASELEPWVGRYAMELRVASTARLPLMPADRSTTVSHLLVELRLAPDGTPLQHHRVCAVRMENSSLLRTTVPPGFVNALAPREYPLRLHGGGGAWRYEADMGFDAIGFDPRATGGALPRDPADPGVVDADGDGNPGATIRIRIPLIGSGSLFIAQRTHLVLRAEDATPERTEGSVDIRLMEQHTLAAEPGRFRVTPDLRPDPSRSGFTLVRLPDGYGCVEVAARAEALFGAARR